MQHSRKTLTPADKASDMYRVTKDVLHLRNILKDTHREKAP